MKKLMKILQKTAFVILCFLLLPGIHLALNRVISSANMSEIEVHIPTTCYVSMHIDYLGERVKCAAVDELEVTVAVRNDEERQEKDLKISFFAQKMPGNWELPVAHFYEDDMAYYWARGGEWKPIDKGDYKAEAVYLFYNHNSDDILKYSSPTTEDVYGEKAHILLFKVRISNLISDNNEVKTGRICTYTETRYNLDHTEWGGGGETIYYATDGEYIAFSKVSYEDAESILTGEPVKPTAPSEPKPPACEPDEPVDDPVDEPLDCSPSFWESLSDLFDGCN